jgi:hypothetical protein
MRLSLEEVVRGLEARKTEPDADQKEVREVRSSIAAAPI